MELVNIVQRTNAIDSTVLVVISDLKVNAVGSQVDVFNAVLNLIERNKQRILNYKIPILSTRPEPIF